MLILLKNMNHILKCISHYKYFKGILAAMVLSVGELTGAVDCNVKLRGPDEVTIRLQVAP